MTLHVHTARISYGGPDRLDITRGSGSEGLVFAPSWALLTMAKMMAKRGQAAADAAWSEYVPTYLAEMSYSQRHHQEHWLALLRRPRVVLVCYCPSRERCHRGLLASLLAGLGAVDEGELPANPNQLELKL